LTWLRPVQLQTTMHAPKFKRFSTELHSALQSTQTGRAAEDTCLKTSNKLTSAEKNWLSNQITGWHESYSF